VQPKPKDGTANGDEESKALKKDIGENFSCRRTTLFKRDEERKKKGEKKLKERKMRGKKATGWEKCQRVQGNLIINRQKSKRE